MSLDDLPPLPLPVDAGGKLFVDRVVAAARRVIATTSAELNVPYLSEDYWQKLDIFLPQKTKPTGMPVYCFLHGGGWFAGHKEWVSFMAPAILALPAIFVAPSYRHVPQASFPAQLNDCADAIAWIHRNIARYGGDPDRLHLGGHSAGGHLAALTALRRDALSARGLPDDVIKSCHPVSARYDLRIDPIGPTPLEGGKGLVEAFLGDRAQAAAASPIAHVAGNKTPFFVAWGSADLTGFPAQARAFVATLQREGCIVEQQEFAGYDHFMMSERCAQADHPWLRRVGAWLRNPPA